MNKRFKKLLASLLTIAMLMSMLPATVFSEEAAEPTATVEVTEEPTVVVSEEPTEEPTDRSTVDPELKETIEFEQMESLLVPLSEEDRVDYSGTSISFLPRTGNGSAIYLSASVSGIDYNNISEVGFMLRENTGSWNKIYSKAINNSFSGTWTYNDTSYKFQANTIVTVLPFVVTIDGTSIYGTATSFGGTNHTKLNGRIVISPSSVSSDNVIDGQLKVTARLILGEGESFSDYPETGFYVLPVGIYSGDQTIVSKMNANGIFSITLTGLTYGSYKIYPYAGNSLTEQWASNTSLTVDLTNACNHSNQNFREERDETTAISYVDCGDGINHYIRNIYNQYCNDCGSFIKPLNKDETVSHSLVDGVCVCGYQETITLTATPSGEIVEGTTVIFSVESNSDSVTLYIDAFEEGTGNRYTAVEKTMEKEGAIFKAPNQFLREGEKIAWAVTANGIKSEEVKITVVKADIKLNTPEYTGETEATVGEPITFSWTAVDNATGYTAYIRPANNTDDVTNLSGSISGQSVSHTFTEAGSYNLEIYAVGEEGYGASDACNVTIMVTDPVPCDHSGLNYRYEIDTTVDIQYRDTGDGMNHEVIYSYICYCKDCGGFVSDGVKDEYPPKAPHVYDENGICDCGAKVDVVCKHEGTYTDYNVWSDEGQQIAENWSGSEEYVIYSENAENPAKYHNAATLHFRVCNDCGSAFDAVYGTAVPENHNFSNGDICVCGYDRNNCEHRATADSTKHIGIICQQNDAGTHYVVADKYMYTCEYCKKTDCIDEIPRSEDQWELKEHEWDKDGVCQSEGCGFECAHANYGWTENGKGTTVKIDDKKHRYMFPVIYFCTNCDATWEGTESTEGEHSMIPKTNHDYDNNSHWTVTTRYCSCGYAEEPKVSDNEPHIYEKITDFERIRCTDTSKGGSYHEVMKTEFTSCTCGKRLPEKMSHYMYESHTDVDYDGICDMCDYMFIPNARDFWNAMDSLDKYTNAMDNPLINKTVTDYIGSLDLAEDSEMQIIDAITKAPYPYQHLYIYSMFEYGVFYTDEQNNRSHFMDEDGRNYIVVENNTGVGTWFHESGHALDYNAVEDDGIPNEQSYYSIFFRDCDESIYSNIHDDIEKRFLYDIIIENGGDKLTDNEIDQIIGYILEDYGTLQMTNIPNPTSNEDAIARIRAFLPNGKPYAFYYNWDIDVPASLNKSAQKVYIDTVKYASALLCYNASSYPTIVQDTISGMSNSIIRASISHNRGQVATVNGRTESLEFYYYDESGNPTGMHEMEIWAEYFNYKMCSNSQALDTFIKYFPETAVAMDNFALELLNIYKNKH